MSITRTRILPAVGLAAVAAFALSACGSSDSLEGGGSTNDGGGDSSTIVIGSQQYYSNEIVAEIYAQALEAADFTVERNFSIGQRDAYMPSLEDGSIDLFPEYTGNLLQYYDAEATATTPDDVFTALEGALPDGLTALEYSPATDQDSYNVTAAFAEENGVASIADLAGIDGLTLGGAPELETRPYGPEGLKSVYDVDVQFEATADTTVDELVAGNIQVANVYSADPRIETQDLLTLEDPEGLFLSSNVVPIANSDIAEEIADVINEVSAAMSLEELVAMNVQSSDEQRSTEDIAADWIADNLG